MRAPRNTKTKVLRATRRNERNRKPPAREALAPDGPQLKNSQESPVEFQFLRLPEVKAVTGLGKTSIYELIRDKSFLRQSALAHAQLRGSDPKSRSGL